jgi:hypothetical protein
MLGLIILTHLDEMARHRDNHEAFKRSLVSSGRFDHEKLFPDYFIKSKEVIKKESADPPTDAEWDYSEVKWKSPGEGGAEEYQRMIELINQANGGSISGDQMGMFVPAESEPTWTPWN